MAETNAQRKKRRVVPNTLTEPSGPALPLAVTAAQPPTQTAPSGPAAGLRDAAQQDPDFFRPERDTGVVAEFGRGVESGVETVQGLRQGFQGAVAGSLGFEDEAQRRLALQQERNLATQINAPRIERVQDVHNIKDAADFVAGIAGKQGVIFAPIIAGGIAGASTRTLPAIARNVSPAVATGAGAIGAGAGLEGGDAFGNIVGDQESVDNLGVAGASRLALGTGAVAGSVEAVPGIAALKRVGLLRPFQRAVRRKLLDRVARGTLSQAAIEGGTEAVQTIIQRTAANFANENREILGEEGLDELLNATVAGAIFGAGVGGVTGSFPQRGSVEDQVDLEETLDDLDAVGGRSKDVERDIDDLGDIGRDIRDARVRVSADEIFEDPAGVVEQMVAVAQREGQLPNDDAFDRMYAAIREMEQPENQVAAILESAGFPPDQVELLAGEMVATAQEQEAQNIEDLATARGQSLDVEAGADPTEEGQFDQFSEGFQELFLTRDFLFRNKNGKLGFIPSDDPTQENALRTFLGQLESDFPDITFDTVGLGDAIVEELGKQVRNDPERLQELLLDVATQKLNEPGFNAANRTELDPANPRAFLNQFKAIRREVIDTSLTGVDPLRLTDSDLRDAPTRGFVTVAEKKVDGKPTTTATVGQRKPKHPVLAKRKPTESSDFVAVRPVKKKTADGTTTVDENQTVDAISLTNKMLTKLGVEDNRSIETLANAFFNGLAALGQRGVKIDATNISPDTVIFKKGEREITFGDISSKGAGRIRARIKNQKAREARLKNELQQVINNLGKIEDPAKRRKSKFIMKKLKRRIERIPDESAMLQIYTASIKRDAGKLIEGLKDAKALLQAEEKDLEALASIAKDVDELLFAFKSEGLHTLQVEKLADAKAEMDAIVQAGFRERARIKTETAPEGSGDSFGAEAGEGSAASRQEQINAQHDLGDISAEMRGDADQESFEEGSSKRQRKVKRAWKKIALDDEGTDTPRATGKDDPIQVGKDMRKVGEDLIKDFGLEDTQMVTGEYFVKKLLTRDFGMKDIWEKMVIGRAMGFRLVDEDTGKTWIVINPFISNKKRAMEAVAHEVGHAIQDQHFDENTDAGKAIMADYEKWRASIGKQDKAAAVLASRATYQKARAVLVKLGDQRLDELTAEQREYVMSFKEWFADQVARHLTDQPSPSKALSSMERVFKQIADDTRALFEKLIKKFGFRPAKSVRLFLDQIIHENQAEPEILSEDLMNVLKGLGLSSDTPAVAGLMQTLDPWGQNTGYLLRRAFSQVLKPEERNTLYKYFNRVSVKRRLKDLTGTQEQKDLIEGSPLHATIFGYQQWIAGNLKLEKTSESVAAQQGIVVDENTGPAARFVANIFQNLFDLFASRLGFVGESEKAKQILEGIRDGYVEQRKAGQMRWSVVESVRETLLQRIVQSSTDTFYNHVFPIFDKALGVTQQRMLETGIPGLQAIANAYYSAVGTEKNTETFFEARRAKIGLFMNDYTEVTRELRQDDALKADVLAALRNPKKMNKDPEVKRITQEIFRFNRRFRNYLEKAGLSIGDRGPRYFPWVWDPQKMVDNNQWFRDLLNDERFAPEMNKWLENLNEEIRIFNATKVARLPEKPAMTMPKLVNHIMSALINNEGMADVDVNLDSIGTTPWFAGMQHRALAFFTDSGKLTDGERERFDGLFSDQLDYIMQTYIRQGVKRAEYARRFGARSEKIEDMIQNAKDEGASKAQMNMAYKYIDAMNGTIGAETNSRIYKTLGLGHPDGEMINPHWQQFTSIMMVIQNMAVLPLATLTSLADPVGIAVRSQDMKATMAALRAGAKEIAFEIRNIAGDDPKAQQTELRRLAQGMGTIEDHLTNEALEWQYGSTYLTPRFKAVNEFFFKAIGLSQWTRITRIAGLAAARSFIKRHVQDKNADSDRFLRQLGITDADVKFDKNGDVRVLTRAERETDSGVTEEEIARDDRVRNALNRFTDEAILRPTAANRPTWASDPNFALFFHLKSFMFTFHDRILRRSWNEMEVHGNPMPFMMLSMFIPVMLFGDLLRDLIRFGLDGNPRKAHWGLEDHIWSATQRSGLNGIGQLLIDAKQDVQFGGVGYESFAGPTADGVADLGGLFAEDDEQQWRAATRNLPGNSVWKHWFENGFDEDGPELVSFQN